MTSTKIIDKRIATFTTNVGKLKAQAHEIAVMIFDHALAHGDCTRAIKLAKALPNSWQLQMEAWFKAFSPIRVIIKNDKCEFDPAYKKATAENKPSFWDRESALNTPFNELSDEAEVKTKVYDFAALVAMVQGLSKSIEKKIEKGTVPEEDIASAKAIAQVVAGLNFQRVRAEAETSKDNTQDNSADQVEDNVALKAVA